MQMRVTLQSQAIPLKEAMRRHGLDVQESQEQISSGKRLHRPSDDPVAARLSLLTRARLAQIDQFLSNIDVGEADLNMADSILGQVTDRIVRAKEIAVRMSDDASSTSAREVAAFEVDQLIDELLALANTSFRGRHLFAGENTVQAPFTRDGDTITYTGTDAGVERRISQDAPLIETTFSGKGVFFENRDGNGVVQDGIFAVLVSLKQALAADDGEAIAATIDQFDAEIERNAQARAVVGARAERMEQTKQRLLAAELQLQDLKSTVEDADLAEAITDFQVRQTALQATLGITARIVPSTLLDFLF